MNKHISMKFDVVEEHVTDLKLISRRVGAVSRNIENCSSVLRRGNNLSDSLYKQANVIRKNVDSINRSLTDAYLTLDRIRDLYYKTEKLNFTAITGKKPYEDMNLIDKIKHHAGRVGNAVVTSINKCFSPVKAFLPGGQYWEVTKQSLKLAAITTVAVVGLAGIMAAPTVGLFALTAAVLNGKKIISGVVKQSRNWAYSLTGEYDKIEDVSWLEIGLSTFKMFKGLEEFEAYKDNIKLVGTVLEVAKETGEYLGDAYQYAVGQDADIPSAVKTGSDILFSVMGQMADTAGDKLGSNLVTIGKELYKFSSSFKFQTYDSSNYYGGGGYGGGGGSSW
jgi:hypothetical protein